MERLTEYWNGQYIADIYEDEANESGYFPLSNHKVQNLVNKLAEYEDKQEQGLLVELPVPLGSEVWTIIESTDGSGKYWLIPYRTNFVLSMLPRWGNKFFPTRSEAEEIIAKTEEKMGCKYVFKK